MFSFFPKIKEIYQHPLVVGIDISDYSIEIFQLSPEMKIKTYGRTILEKGIIKQGRIKNEQRLSEIFQEIIKKTGLDGLMKKHQTRIKGIFSLPGSKTFIREFVFDSNKRLEEKIKNKIKENIPFLFDEIYWDYIEIDGKKKKKKESEEVRVIAVSSPKEVVEEYIEFFWKNGVDPIVFDIEADSIARSLLKEKDSTAILDLGAKNTVINIFNQQKLAISLSFIYGGNYFTRQISEKLTITEAEAEKIKEESGFIKEPASYILEQYFFVLVKEIKDTLKYYQNKFGQKTTKIILTGGGSLLPGIGEYFQDNFDETIEIGNSLQKIIGDASSFGERSILFSNAIGLAIRGIEDDFIYSGINILPDFIKKHERVLQKERKRFFVLMFLFFLSIIIFLFIGLIFLT